MTEKLAFIVFAAFPVPTSILIIAGLVVAIVILFGAILLFRSPGKNKGANAEKSGGASGWQPQGQQQAMPGGWNQAGMGGSADSAWGQQQQPGAWGAQSSAQQQQQPGAWGAPQQQQPGAWGAQAPAQQQSASPWGSPSSAQQQSSTWGNASPSTPSAGAGMGGNQPGWDATLAAQQPAASQPQDSWGQPPASPMQQGAPVWGGLPGGQAMQNSTPSQQQQAPTSYGGSGSGQSWGQSNQPASTQQGWGQSPQQQSASTPSPATGGNQGMPSWQQGSGLGQGQGFSSPGMRQDAASMFPSADSDRTILRPSSPQGTTGIVRVEEGKEPGRVYEVRKDELSIGRSRESDIFLEDLAVSRLHAKILSLGNGNYALKDEGSANGTKVNGQLVNKHQTYPLQEGDKIQLGQTVLVFARR
ncbi:MAG: FHA domain-containing protein [Chloroflexi bacterium]|nr:MAG: FHA domain-containing protein [Chloroflexota bacterium]